MGSIRGKFPTPSFRSCGCKSNLTVQWRSKNRQVAQAISTISGPKWTCLWRSLTAHRSATHATASSPRRRASSSMSPVKGDKSQGGETMKLMGLTSLLAVVSVVGNLSFFRAHLRAAEKTKETPITIRLDFIVGGNHAPWFVALEKGFYAKRGLNVTIQPGTGSAD